MKPTGRFGELGLDGETIVSFHEKPEPEAAQISGGFFVFNRAISEYLTRDDCVLEKQPPAHLAAAGQLKAWQHAGFWQCMDTYREQQLLEQMWQEGRAPWKVW